MTHLTTPVTLRWSDLDPNGHVNNVAYLTILEDVRIRALHPIIGSLADESGAILHTGRPPVVVAGHEIEYVAQMPWTPKPIEVELWVSRIGRSSVEISQLLRSPADDPEQVYAKVLSALVYLDPDAQRPRALSDTERASFATILDDPVELRRATRA